MARRVVLLTPYNEFGVMVEDIVSFAIEIACKRYGLEIDYNVIYRPCSSRSWTLAIDDAEVSSNQLPSLPDIVDLITMASIPEEHVIDKSFREAIPSLV